MQHWGRPNVSQKGETRDGCGFRKTWNCSDPAEAFPMHLCLLITCKALGFYDLQAIRWMFDSGKPRDGKENLHWGHLPKVTASSTWRATQRELCRDLKAELKLELRN